MLAETEVRKAFIEPANIETVEYPREYIEEMLKDIKDAELRIANGEDRSFESLLIKLGINLD